MSTIYITGHRNPDLDSLCSAMAYANLKSLTDPANDYIPVRCSHMRESDKALLTSLGLPIPVYMRDVLPKVSDVMLTKGSHLKADSPLTDYAKHTSLETPSATPVFEGDRFIGLITMDDVLLWTMQRLAEDGQITEIPAIRDLMRDQSLILQADDLLSEGKELLRSSNKRGLAVFRDGEYVGYVTRRCFLNTPKYDVILVDHNETSQSIRGIENANVVEIIDHHRLNAMKTSMPLFIDAEPLGSTCTIVYQLYLRNGIRPSRDIAKVLLTGILSDTLILRSPTTTQIDIESAASLSAMCRVDTQEYGRSLFSNVAGLAEQNPQTAILSDFKSYTERGLKVGVGQCEVTTLNDLPEYRETYLAALADIRNKNNLDWALVMITDVIKEHSVLLCTDFRAERRLPYNELTAQTYDMPGVMSRKKQLLPEILRAIDG